MQCQKAHLDAERSKHLDLRKQAKLQWSPKLSQTNDDNIKKQVRCQNCRHSRNKKRGYLKYKIKELQANKRSKIITDLYRGINEFKKGYQSRTNLVKNENGDLIASSPNIFNTCKNNFCHLLKIHIWG